MPKPATSGDPVADRRFAYALQYREAGDHVAAAELIAQALECAPDWPAGWFALGEAWEAAGRPDEASAAWERAVSLDPADRAGAGPRLARLRGIHPRELPSAHVAALFDEYADRFEAHLVEALQYRGPDLIIAALDAVAPDRRFHRALDLGCGTGLMGQRLRGRVDRLEGVDLSPAMVAKAAATGLYDALSVGDAVAALDGAWDLIVAADVLVYMGDLTPLFSALSSALTRDGLFAATVENGPDEGFVLQHSLRYAHGRGYLRALARRHGLTVERLEPVVTRRDAGADVPGLLVVLRLV